MGTHTVSAVDALNNSASSFFTVGQKISISPENVSMGDLVTVNGSGFSVSSGVTILLDGNPVTTTPAQVLTDQNGSFVASFLVPPCSGGNHTVLVQDAQGFKSTATLTISSKITATPSSGTVGTLVTVSGTGFSALTNVVVLFANEQVGTLATDANGSFTGLTFTVPASAAGGQIVTERHLWQPG